MNIAEGRGRERESEREGERERERKRESNDIGVCFIPRFTIILVPPGMKWPERVTPPGATILDTPSNAGYSRIVSLSTYDGCRII